LSSFIAIGGLCMPSLDTKKQPYRIIAFTTKFNYNLVVLISAT
jgi:hypothetical protein